MLRCWVHRMHFDLLTVLIFVFRSVRKFKLDPNAKEFTPASFSSLPATPIASPVSGQLLELYDKSSCEVMRMLFTM